MTINELGGEFQCECNEETLLALINKIDELVRESNRQDVRISLLTKQLRDVELDATGILSTMRIS